jgi:hypothetical protein
MRGSSLVHCGRYLFGIDPAFSSVSDAETAILLELARNEHTLVEIGVFEGRTSKALRKVMHPNGMLWLIDPFLPGLIGFNSHYVIARQEIASENNGFVGFIRKMSCDAAEDWHTPYDFLFIDADHQYEAVKRDWQDWSRFARPGAHIALHDSCCLATRCKPTDGPVRLVEEIKLKEGKFKLVHQVESLSVFRRL